METSSYWRMMTRTLCFEIDELHVLMLALWDATNILGRWFACGLSAWLLMPEAIIDDGMALVADTLSPECEIE